MMDGEIAVVLDEDQARTCYPTCHYMVASPTQCGNFCVVTYLSLSNNNYNIFVRKAMAADRVYFFTKPDPIFQINPVVRSIRVK